MVILIAGLVSAESLPGFSSSLNEAVTPRAEGITMRNRSRVLLLQAQSVASRVFLVLLAAVIVITLMVTVFLVIEAQRSARTSAELVTKTTAVSVAHSPQAISALESADLEAATRALNPVAAEIVEATELDFVVIMTPEGVRVTHPRDEEIGNTYLGTIPNSPESLSEVSTGTLGPSVRTITPVLDGERHIGWVSAGITTESIADSLTRRLPLSLGLAVVIVAVGAVGAWVARRVTRRITGDLHAGQVRDAVSSYESIRTLGEALRAQTHEHGNRMHTAVALIEMGRSSEAIEMLTETSKQSQTLVDVVTNQHGDPAIGALLLGKASQAKERGIDWQLAIDPDTPRSTLAAIDSVSVFGNLIDNALDAAGDSEDPWVRVSLRPEQGDRVSIEVADSGAGVPNSIRDRIFEHGYSTKASDALGRGVGLALVQSIVMNSGGSIEVFSHPTVFRVTVPAVRRKLRTP